VVRCLAVDPSNPDRIYAGTDGGLWTTRNAGSSWELAGTGIPRTPVYALALDAKDAMLWAGTARGLFRSGDAGRTWTPVPSASGIPVTAIAVEPARNLVLAGTLGSGLQRVPVGAESPAN
jgi:ligand-binding sensor domain-containing protein